MQNIQLNIRKAFKLKLFLLAKNLINNFFEG